MKRKYKLLLLMIVSLLFLVGWGKKNVELLNDKKLIDLNAALGNCKLGAEDLIPDEGEITAAPAKPTATPRPTVTPKPTATPRPTATPTPAPTEAPKPRTIIIRVRDREVFYDSEEWQDLDDLKAQIQEDHGDLISFRLVDDFAEAHVYRRIMAILAELETEHGIRYSKD